MNDLYTTKRLIQCVEAINPADSFLRDRYFPTNGAADVFATQEVLVEYKDGDMRLAPIVTKGNRQGIAMSRPAVEMERYTPPTIMPTRPLTADILESRGFGEALYGDETPEERALKHTITDLVELDHAITRREEAIAASVMIDNAADVKPYGKEADGEEDTVAFYNGTNNAAFTTSNKWNAAAADILTDLENMARNLTRRGLRAEDFVCAPDVAKAIINNNAVQDLLDNRRYDMGIVAPELTAPGAVLVCQLNVNGRLINVISYDQVYTADDGTVKQYIPAGTGIMTAPDAGHTVYGAVTQIDHGATEFATYALSRVPKFLPNPDNDTRELRLAARPLCMPYNRDAFIAAKNLLN